MHSVSSVIFAFHQLNSRKVEGEVEYYSIICVQSTNTSTKLIDKNCSINFLSFHFHHLLMKVKRQKMDWFKWLLSACNDIFLHNISRAFFWSP